MVAEGQETPQLPPLGRAFRTPNPTALLPPGLTAPEAMRLIIQEWTNGETPLCPSGTCGAFFGKE